MPSGKDVGKIIGRRFKIGQQPRGAVPRGSTEPAHEGARDPALEGGGQETTSGVGAGTVHVGVGASTRAGYAAGNRGGGDRLPQDRAGEGGSGSGGETAHNGRRGVDRCRPQGSEAGPGEASAHETQHPGEGHLAVGGVPGGGPLDNGVHAGADEHGAEGLGPAGCEDAASDEHRRAGDVVLVVGDPLADAVPAGVGVGVGLQLGVAQGLEAQRVGE